MPGTGRCRKKIRTIAVLFYAAVILLAGSGTASAVYTTSQLTDNSRSDYFPRINKVGQIVWSGYDGEDWEIFVYAGGTTTQLTNDSLDDSGPLMNDIGQIVWSRSDGNDSEIIFYDGTGITQLTDNEHWDFPSDINNAGQFTFTGYDGVDTEVFLYSGGIITQITDNTFSDQNPQLNDGGQIAWTGYHGSDTEVYDSEILMYSDGAIQQLTDNSVSDTQPKINNAGQVVWEGHDGEDYEIFLYGGGNIEQLTSNDFIDHEVVINDSGQVAWIQRYGWDIVTPPAVRSADIYPAYPDTEIFLYSNGNISRITDNQEDENNLAINGNGELVWTSWVGGAMEVFHFGGGIITRLSNNTSWNWAPRINDAGYVVWEGRDGDDQEIFLARPSMESRPVLVLSFGDRKAFWNNYEDFLSRRVSVDYLVVNNGMAPVYNVKLSLVQANSGVTCLTPAPLAIGDIDAGPGSAAGFTLVYDVPAGVSRFSSRLYVEARNSSGSLFIYP